MIESIPGLLREAFSSREPAKVVQRQRTRLADMVAHARSHSPYYRELYQGLPERIEDATLLPVTSKKELMAQFGDWATDREVTLEKAQSFIADPELVGEPFLDKYTIATTSGTTGKPGIFVIDDRVWSVSYAMMLRAFHTWLGFGDIARILAGGRRMALTVAPGHTATAVAAASLLKSSSRRKRVLAIPIHAPLAEMVSQLNAFQPALLAPYASITKLLAAEQEAGRLAINPVLVVPAAEGLPVSAYDRISRTFRAKVRHSYAATECTFVSYSCDHGWLHVNSDWVVLEPVDADYRPSPPGEQSHTVLISNLANRVQPILRYDLGDRVLQRPSPCPCGNPLPAIRVHGRTADVLHFSTERGERIAIPALALEVDNVPGIALFQLVQTSTTSLHVRLRLEHDAEPECVWQAVMSMLSQRLAQRGLSNVTVERADKPPEQTPGGKFRTVISAD